LPKNTELVNIINILLERMHEPLSETFTNKATQQPSGHTNMLFNAKCDTQPSLHSQNLTIMEQTTKQSYDDIKQLLAQWKL
jgi:formaldehyde-activating enzyme involved in methanogenesis